MQARNTPHSSHAGDELRVILDREAWRQARKRAQKRMREVIRAKSVVTTGTAYRRAIREVTPMFVQNVREDLARALCTAAPKLKKIHRESKRKSAVHAGLFERANRALANPQSVLHARARRFAEYLGRSPHTDDAMRMLRATFGTKAIAEAHGKRKPQRPTGRRAPRRSRSSRRAERPTTAPAPPTPGEPSVPAPDGAPSSPDDDPDLANRATDLSTPNAAPAIRGRARRFHLSPCKESLWN